MNVLRRIALAALLLVGACGSNDGLDQPPPPLGDFRLGHNVVVGETAKLIPPSRGATAEQWELIFEDEIAKRFGRYQGEGLYHLGVSVDAYALAIPGVPVVLKPRSVLVFSVTVWDNATAGKINPEVKQITVFERLGLSGESLIGSGITQTKEEQMRNLSYAAALAIQKWLEPHKDIFDPDPAIREAARAALVAEIARGPQHSGN